MAKEAYTTAMAAKEVAAGLSQRSAATVSACYPEGHEQGRPHPNMLWQTGGALLVYRGASDAPLRRHGKGIALHPSSSSSSVYY
jgi:hypothetical protein